LMTDYEGTKTALVAEVDCDSKGKDLCEDKGVTGFPRLLWGKAEDLAQYSGGRSYEELKSFARDHLGDNCGPSNLELCETKQKELMKGLANLTPEKREETAKLVEKAVKKAERHYEDAQWNFTLQIDLAEQEKDKQIKVIKDQGLPDARQVQGWNKKQPPGFWKPPPRPSPPPTVLEETVFEVAGNKVTNLHLCGECLHGFCLLDTSAARVR